MRKASYFSGKRILSFGLAAAMLLSTMHVSGLTVQAADPSGVIENDSLSVQIGDLGQISRLNIKNNRNDMNFVLPNDSSGQNNTAHQWMGEMIFSYRTSDTETFPEGREGFVEVDTNRTLAAGGSTTYSDATENLESNPYIEKKVEDKKVTVDFKGQELDSGDSAEDRIMRGFDVESVYDTDQEDGSMLWSITLKNTSGKYMEFGDIGLPMPWNNKYATINDTYNNRVTVHTYAGADSGYAYAIRCSGEGNYMLFTPVPESGARIEYIDQWIGSAAGGMNGVSGTRNGPLYANWTSDTGGWFPGLQVYYIHSKDIQKTGRGYYTDATSLVLKPGETKTYQFKFSAIRAGDNTPGTSAEDANNASNSVEEREANQRSVLYDSGMIDAIAAPGFQTAINMPTKLDLHYDDSRITDVKVDIQCLHENDPWDEEHIPEQDEGLVNNARAIGECKGGDAAAYKETKEIDGEKHHIYDLTFGCIGNNSVRVSYKLDGVEKFTQFEFNVLDELDKTIEAHSSFVADTTQDNDPDSATYGIYSDWYFASGRDGNQQDHWGDDWSHDNINFMAMKNYLDPDKDEIASIEKYLIDFMWNNYMKNNQEDYTVANYLDGSGVYGGNASYTRTYSQVMEATGFFNMYRIEKAYPDLMEYRESPEWYLEKAYGIYYNQVDDYPIGYYGEQQIPDMIEALYDEGMTEEGDNLKELFAKDKGTEMAEAAYPYGSEFEYDNTGEEGAYAAAKALREYYPGDRSAAAALSNMEKAEWKTRAMRGIQPTWYQYADPVFRGGETWWNFQYTASLAGSIMDDWLRYQENGWDTDSSAWAERVNYAAKLSNFNAINMGQISDKYIGNVSWRYTMAKGGQGAQNVNDGGTRVMNNGWNDFSGESDEGLYGSLLRISSDVVTDPVFGLIGYGSTVSKSGDSYTITPLDGVGKRINVIDSKVYVELEQDSATQAVIKSDGTSISLDVNNLTGKKHVSKITLSGAGVKDGYYSIKVNGGEAGQVYVSGNKGVAYAEVPEAGTAKIVIEKMSGGENTAPKVTAKAVVTEETEEKTLKALVPFRLQSEAYDDGAPDGTLTYKWEVIQKPQKGELTLDADTKPYAQATASYEGSYKVKLTVSDGEKSSEYELDISVGKGPEKKAPVIVETTAKQDAVNTTVAKLTGSAEADEVYKNELKYKWTIVSQPEGAAAVLADADKEQAYLKANVPGTYVLQFEATDEKSTEYDETVSSQNQVTIEMTGAVDGVERAKPVLTKAGTAPELPETMTMILADGTRTEKHITWTNVEPEQYAAKGEFTVSGTADDTELKTEVRVIVVDTDARNLAPFAETAGTANYDGKDGRPYDLGGLEALNNEYEPSNSRDTSHLVWHNWQTNNADDAFVQYTWDEEVMIYQTDAYYFTDGNFVPKSVVFKYLDENGEWQEIGDAEGLGTELDQYNTTTFAPIKTKGIQMWMTPLTLGCGVIEWKVFGYGLEDRASTSVLKSVISHANSLNMELFVEGSEDTLKAAVAEAQAVLDNKKATQDEVDTAAAKLAQVIAGLQSVDGNLAYSASVSTSFVSGWESLDAVNDGKLPPDSNNPAAPRYGTWGNASEYETITYTWDSAVTIKEADIYFWYDGEHTDDGGINLPTEYYYEYLDEDGNWQKVEEPSGYGLEIDQMNNTKFTPVTTTAIRVTLKKQEEDWDGNGVGVYEWKVYNEIPEVDKTALEAAIQQAQDIADAGQSNYTDESWQSFLNALETAKQTDAKDDASYDEVQNAKTALIKAMNALLVKEPEGMRNLAPDAAADGICNYDGQDGRPYDQGGLPKLNDEIDPASSSDLTNGAWFNWVDRYDAEGNPQNAWVSYTWDQPVILNSMDVYYFSEGEGAGHEMPKSVTLEYLDENGDWQPLEGAQGLGCERDQYNQTSLGDITTKGLRMTMEPQYLSAEDPAHGVGVIEWKVFGIYASESADKAALEKAVEQAEELTEDGYTAASWEAFAVALSEAQKLEADLYATPAQVEAARQKLLFAMNALEKEGEEPEYKNIAPDAAADGICNYDGQDGRPYDQGGLPKLNDGIDPASSSDLTNGAWFNWADRYDAEGNPQNAWVSYTWDQPVILNSMDVYYFSEGEGAGHEMPESVTLEYLDENGDWQPLEDALGLGCLRDTYNRTLLGNITAKGLRMTMEPQYMNAGDPAHGVGVIEWKVYGKYIEETEVNKDALRASIQEAERRNQADYTAQSWADLERALAKAKDVEANGEATQAEVNQAAALLNAAISALVSSTENPPAGTDKKALQTVVDEGGKYTRADYTEESWASFAAALSEAQRVLKDQSATTDQVNKATEALKAAIKGLVRVNPSVDLRTLRDLVAQAEGLKEADYTAETWKILQKALEDARAALNTSGVTQNDVDLKAKALEAAIRGLKKVDQGSQNGQGGSQSTSPVETGDRAPIVVLFTLLLASAWILIVFARRRIGSRKG